MNDYHITRPAGTQEGPFSEEELKELYRNRKLPQDSLVWTPGWDTWKICQDTFSWYAVPPPLPISIAPPPIPADYIAVINENLMEQSNTGGVVSGIWEGVCINTTYGGSAPIEISIQQNDNIITGYISIKGNELGGSGEISGMTNGNSITFTSPGDNDTMTGIQWEGVITGEEINGTYLVNPSLHGISIGMEQQYGVFNAKRQ